MNVDSIIIELKKQLVPYLRQHGINILNKNVPCIFSAERHKNGKDNHPSMGLLKSHDATHCFTCGGVADIFTWANKLEGLPIGKNKEFYTITVPTLAKRLLDINYVPEKLSPEDAKIALIRQSYISTIEAASNINDNVKQYIKERKWNEDLIRKFKIGSVNSFNDYIANMTANGYTIDTLYRCGLVKMKDGALLPADKQIITENRMVIPVFNEHGNIIRIVTRSLDKDDKIRYLNTSNNELNEDFPKIFGANLIHNNEHVYIVEGYSDVITMYKHGYENTVAVLGSHINLQHILYLKRLGVRTITILFDGDKKWEQSLYKSLVEIMTNVQINIAIGIIDSDMDPDEYLRQYGTLSGLKVVSPFTWMIEYKSRSSMLKENIVSKYTDIIANTDSAIVRSKWIKELAANTDISEKIIRQEVNEKIEKRKDDTYKSKHELKKEVGMLLKDSDFTLESLEAFIKRKKTSKKIYNIDPITIASEILSETKIITDTAVDRPAMYLGNNLTNFCKDVEGFSRDGNIILISGDSHAGKSSFLRFLAIEIAKSNKDVSVIYFSMEDGKQKTIPAFLSVLNGYPINSNKNKNRMRQLYGQKGIDQYETAWDKLIELFSNRKLFLYDRTIGESLDDIEKILDSLLEENIHEPIVMIDSINSMASNNNSGGENESVIQKTRGFRTLATIKDLPIFLVAEIKKVNGAPKNQDLSYSKRLEYASDVIMFVDKVNESSPTSPMYLPYMNGDAPVSIQTLRIEKNKINGVTGKWNLLFASRCNRYKEVLL